MPTPKLYEIRLESSARIPFTADLALKVIEISSAKHKDLSIYVADITDSLGGTWAPLFAKASEAQTLLAGYAHEEVSLVIKQGKGWLRKAEAMSDPRAIEKECFSYAQFLPDYDGVRPQLQISRRDISDQLQKPYDPSMPLTLKLAGYSRKRMEDVRDPILELFASYSKKIAEENRLSTLIDQEVLYQKVDEIEFSVRTANGLKNKNVVYIGDLITSSPKELMGNNQIGKGSITEILNFLEPLGLGLAMDVPGWPPENLEEKIAEIKRKKEGSG